MANLGNFQIYFNKDCKGDKIRLPESASKRLFSVPNLVYPLCFELAVPISRQDMLNAMQSGQSSPQRRSIYCGVLEFNAAENCVCVPQWIMDNLKLSDGATVNITNITLPKGNYVQLQPHTLLKDVKTKQKLESSLRQFTTLTANTTIVIQEMDNIKINILRVKPYKNNPFNSIHIVDTDLTVEFEAPLDGSGSASGLHNIHYNRDLIVNDNDIKSDEITDSVNKGKYRFYKLKLMNSNKIDSIKISAKPDNNDDDIDLYASFKSYEPGTKHDNYDYHNVDHGESSIIINLSDNDNDCLYIGVHGFDNPAINDNNDNDNKQDGDAINYTLKIVNISMDAAVLSDLYRVSSLTTHDDNNNNDKIDVVPPMNDDPTKKFCVNCHRFVNKWSYDRHYSHCVKQFYYCVSCSKVIKLIEIDKHNKTQHNDLECRMCLEMISGGKQTLISHQKYECLKRPINCTYCSLPFAYINHNEHELMCGSRTELCQYCQSYIALSLIKQHTNDVHGAQYEEPIALVRNQSDVNDVDDKTYQQMNLGGINKVPARDINNMLNKDDNNNNKSVNIERWICESCDYSNRPFRNTCAICKHERTIHSKKVSETDKHTINDNKANNNQKKDVKPIAIGGNAVIPDRDYDNLLNTNNDATVSVKPPLFQYNDKQNDAAANNNDIDIKLSSTTDPSTIPKRDYDKMLNNPNNIDPFDDIDVIDDIINDDMNDDILMRNIDDDQDKDVIKLSTTDKDKIPQRNYDAMLNKTDPDYDQLAEQQALIAQYKAQIEQQQQQPNNDNDNKKMNLRSDNVIIPNRNYDKLLNKVYDNKLTDNDNNDDVNMDDKTTTTTATAKATGTGQLRGYWLCPSASCDYLNKSTRNNCSRCHTLKPSYKRTASLLDNSVNNLGLENKWVCRGCNGLNKGSRIKCVFCHKEKQYKPHSKATANNIVKSTKKNKITTGIFNDNEKWVCSNKECNFLNKGSRIKCQVCSTERKDQSVVWGYKGSKGGLKNQNQNNDNIKMDKNKKDDNNNNQNKQYSHPLEARMNGMNVDQISNIQPQQAQQVQQQSDNNQINNNLEWPCPICTFLNTSDKCDMCGCPKDAQ